jgi:ribosomal-protein-alanine N-acetyltransferase
MSRAVDPGQGVVRHARARKASRTRIRRATRADLDEIMAIERACFPAPWPATAMEEEIARRSWSRVLLAVDRKAVVGFMVYWVVDDEFHLLNLATHPQHRRQGVARAMVERMLAAAKKQRPWQIVLEVRRSNAEARQLYDGFGFRQIGVRRRYYPDNGEDAVVMALVLDDGRVPIE